MLSKSGNHSQSTLHSDSLLSLLPARCFFIGTIIRCILLLLSPVSLYAQTNQPPVIGGQPVATANYFDTYIFNVQATDPDGDDLSYEIGSWPAATGIAISDTGVVSWTPTRDQVGEYWLFVTVSDGTDETVLEYELALIDPNNQSPVVNNQPITEAIFGTPYTFDPQATDADGDTLSYVVWTWPETTGISIDSNGVVSWQPTRDQVDEYWIGIIIDDGHLGVNDYAYQLKVIDPNNHVPVVNNQPITEIAYGTAYTFDPQVTDADGDTLSYSLWTSPEITSGINIDGNGVISWQPGHDDVGTYWIELKIEDGHLGLTVFEYELTVIDPGNQAPTFTSTPVTQATVGQNYQYTAQATDADGDGIQYALYHGPSGMTVDAASGLVQWTPATAVSAPGEIVKITADDGRGGTTRQDFHIVVNGGSSAPDADGDGIPDDQDAFPNDPNESSDTDGDGVGDNSDPDRDGDGVDNTTDAFPDDAAEWSDIDSDGVGDNSDPDRDGDGFSNSDEQTAGTNPNDGADYPDTVSPALTVSLSSPQTIEADVITVTGTVSDPTQPYSGVTSLQIISDRFPGSPFSGAIDGNQFSVEVPLRVEINTLTITAQDASGNSAQASLVVDRISPPRFVNVTPLSGTVVTTDSITIAGEVHTLLPLTDVQFYINDWQITPDGTGTEGIYHFALPNIPLQRGDNTFALRAIASDGEAVSNLMVRYWPSDADELPAPVITIQSPAPNSLLRDASFRLAARVESAGGPLQIAVNGESQPLLRPDLTAVDFSKLMTFADGQDTLGVVIEATDSLGKTSTVTASYQRDALSPVITINNSLSPSPGINPVLESPYLISGTVADENLANFMVNDAPLALRPGAEPNTYTFTFAVALSSGEQLPLNFAARDFGGNLSELEVILQSQATVGIDALLPADQATFIAGTEPLTVQTVARTSQLQAGDTVVVSIDSGSTITAELSGDLATADMNLPTSSGTYNIQWRVMNTLNDVIATTSRTVKVTQDSDIPVQLLRMEPASNDRYAQPNAPIELYFNKRIDLSLLTVTLRETLHGDTYINTDPAGLDFLQAKGYQLEEVHRDREIVPGSLQLLPGDTSAAFYADRMLGFGADVFVDVSYDGQSLARQQFKVRELPTFVIGGVIDQFGQPLQGVNVMLPDLGRSVVTNGDGSFAFGFQEAADQVIAGGRHRLIINGNLATAGFGSELRTVNLQQHRRNELEVVKLQELNPDLPKQLIEGGRQLSLVGNDLRVDMNNARLRFPDGRDAGIVHTQFVSFEEISVTSPPNAMPHWLYASQPRGIVIDGAVQLDMAMPPLRGSYDYVPTELYQYVVLLGYNADAEVLEPVGVGRIENHRVTSVGPVAMGSFDFFGYALVDPSNTELLEAVANGQVSLQQLKAQLQ